MTDAYYVNDIGILVNTHVKAVSFLNSLEQTAENINLFYFILHFILQLHLFNYNPLFTHSCMFSSVPIKY